MVQVIETAFQEAKRLIEFFHLPVPKQRTDADFYKPLADLLLLPASCELHLGLVHLNDDEGNRNRLNVACQFAKVSGVASECGWGRGNPERVRSALLEAHRKLKSPEREARSSIGRQG